MKKFSTLINEAKVTVTYTQVLDMAKECNAPVPITKKKIDSRYDTSAIAEIVLNGGYIFKDSKDISYAITAEDAAKVPGLTEILANEKGGTCKVGTKTLKINQTWSYQLMRQYTSVSAKAFIITVEGDTVDAVNKSHYPADTLNFIKDGLVVYALKTDMSASQMDMIYGDSDEVNFHYSIQDGQYNIILYSSFDIIKDNKFFYIFGQQNTSKNERFRYYNKDNGDIVYGPIKKSAFMTGSYSKSKIYKRADGMFVAK